MTKSTANKESKQELVRKQRVAKAANKLLKLFGPKGEGWVQGASAVDKGDSTVEPKSRRAVKWCLSGAVEKLNLQSSPFVDELKERVGSIVEFNDSHKTYTHVRRALEKMAAGK
jgi:hypothetical protein